MKEVRKIDVMGKYLSCNNINSDFSKISILIPNTKYITRKQNKHIFSSLSKLYIQKNKFNKNINKSSRY
jgi:hypothetical protein